MQGVQQVSDDIDHGKVVSFGKPKLVEPGSTAVNEDAVQMIEGLLARLKDGTAQAVGFVEVKNHGGVATGWSGAPLGWYHQLRSGAARLLARLSSEDDYP